MDFFSDVKKLVVYRNFKMGFSVIVVNTAKENRRSKLKIISTKENV